MSKHLKNCIHVLDYASKIKDVKNRNQLLSVLGCDERVYRALSEIAQNLIRGNIPLKSADKSPRKSIKRSIIALTNKRASRSQRRKIYANKVEVF